MGDSTNNTLFYEGYEKDGFKSNIELVKEFVHNTAKDVALLMVAGNIMFALYYYTAKVYNTLSTYCEYDFNHIMITNNGLYIAMCILLNIIFLFLFYIIATRSESVLKKKYDEIRNLSFEKLKCYMSNVAESEYRNDKNYKRFCEFATLKLVDSDNNSEKDLFEECYVNLDDNMLSYAKNSLIVFNYLITVVFDDISYIEKIKDFKLDNKVIEAGFVRLIKSFVEDGKLDEAFIVVTEADPTESMLKNISILLDECYHNEFRILNNQHRVIDAIGDKYFEKYPLESLDVLYNIFDNENKLLETILKKLDFSKIKKHKSFKDISEKCMLFLDLEKEFVDRYFVKKGICDTVCNFLDRLEADDVKVMIGKENEDLNTLLRNWA